MKQFKNILKTLGAIAVFFIGSITAGFAFFLAFTYDELFKLTVSEYNTVTYVPIEVLGFGMQFYAIILTVLGIALACTGALLAFNTFTEGAVKKKLDEIREDIQQIKTIKIKSDQ